MERLLHKARVKEQQTLNVYLALSTTPTSNFNNETFYEYLVHSAYDNDVDCMGSRTQLTTQMLQW
eukprot:5095080-Amphidinium_carterae.1